MSKPKENAVEFAFDAERGLTITTADDGGKRQSIHVPRSAVSNASRLALQNFVRILTEVRDFSEIAPGDAVICAEDRTLLCGYGQSVSLSRGKMIDNLAWIEQLLREGCRLLRPNPEGEGDTQTEILRQSLLDESYMGMARNIIIARRASAAANA